MSSQLGNATMRVNISVAGIPQLQRAARILQTIHTTLTSISASPGINIPRMPGGGGGGGGGPPAGGGRSGPVSAFTQQITDLRSASFALRDAGRQFTLFARGVSQALEPAVRVGAEFQQSVKNVQAVIGSLQNNSLSTENAVDDLANSFLRLAEVTKFTGVEVAEGAKQLALAGFSLKEVKDSLEGVLSLAAAGNLDTAEAARIAANALRAFGIEASNFMRVADVLAQVQSNANTTVSALGESLKQVSGTAAIYGVSIEEVAAALGVLANAGLSGSISGTSLNRLFIELTKNGDKLEPILVKFGSSLDAIDIRKNTLSEVFGELERLTAESTSFAQEFAGAMDMRGARAFLAFINQGTDAFDKLLGLAEEATGTSKVIEEIQLDSLAGDMLLLNSRFETFLTELFNTFQEDLRNFVQLLQQGVDWLINFVKENQDLVSTIVKVTAGVAAATVVMGGFLTVIGSIVALFAGLGALVAGLAMLTPPVALFGLAITTVIPFLAALVANIIYFADQSSKAANALNNLSDRGVASFRALSAELEIFQERSKAFAQMGTDFNKVMEILQKGSKATSKELQWIKDTPFYDPKTGKVSAKALEEDTKKMEADLESMNIALANAQINLAEALGNRGGLGRIRPGARKTDDGDLMFGANDSEQIKGLRKNVDDIKKVIADAQRDILKNKTTVEGTNFLFSALGMDKDELDVAKKDLSDKITDLKNQQKAAQDDLIATNDLAFEKKSKDLQVEIAAQESLFEILNKIDPKFNSYYKNRIENGEIAIDDILLEIQALEDLNIEIERLTAKADSFDEKFKDTHAAITEVVESDIERMQRLLEEEIKMRESAIDASLAELDARIKLAEETRLRTGEEDKTLDVLWAQRDAMADQLGLLDDLRDVRQEQIDEQKRQEQERAEKEAKADQDYMDRQVERIDQLDLEAAKREKNFTEYERILRKIRQAEIDSEIDKDFKGADQGTIDQFKALRNAQLEAQLESEKEGFVEKQVAEKSKEAEIQDQIVSSLERQVTTLREAAMLSQFLRAMENRRDKDARLAAQRAVADRIKADELNKRMAGASPEDAAKLRRRVDMANANSQVSQGIAARRSATAGLGGQGLPPMAIPVDAANQMGQGMFNNVKSWMDQITQLFSTAPGQWAAALLQGVGGLPGGVLGGILGGLGNSTNAPPPAANAPGPTSSTTSNGASVVVNINGVKGATEAVGKLRGVMASTFGGRA